MKKDFSTLAVNALGPPTPDLTLLPSTVTITCSMFVVGLKTLWSVSPVSRINNTSVVFQFEADGNIAAEPFAGPSPCPCIFNTAS